MYDAWRIIYHSFIVHDVLFMMFYQSLIIHHASLMIRQAALMRHALRIIHYASCLFQHVAFMIHRSACISHGGTKMFQDGLRWPWDGSRWLHGPKMVLRWPWEASDGLHHSSCIIHHISFIIHHSCKGWLWGAWSGCEGHGWLWGAWMATCFLQSVYLHAVFWSK